MMSPLFEQIKDYYIRDMWSKQRVYNVVDKAITVDEYETIVGENYK